MNQNDTISVQNIKIELLSSNTNTSQLIKQAKKFNVKNLIITDQVKFILIKKRYSKYYKIYNNFDNFDKIFKDFFDITYFLYKRALTIPMELPK